MVEGSYRVSLGDFPAEQSRTVAYTLKNVGDAAIGIASVSRACGCADAFMTTNVVDKGSSVGITFKTYPDKLPGAFVKTFYVITDSPDPRTKLVQLVVTGNGIVSTGRGTNGVAAARSENVALPYTNSFHSFNSVIKFTPYSELTDNFNRLDVEFFVQEGCAECLVLRRDYLPALASRYAYRIRTTVSDTHSISTFLRLLEKLEACGIKANEPVYMVAGGGKVLSGHRGTDKNGAKISDGSPKSRPCSSLRSCIKMGGEAALNRKNMATGGQTRLTLQRSHRSRRTCLGRQWC